ncbi:MAG: ABC transporter ATP-binding protein [Candidatus Saccharibacteria bacterium]|nr:ABC transporter ATP-binding protein [Candidatus Saccharibacteria bacterium]
MRHILRILRSAHELRKYYLGISIVMVFVSLSQLLLPVLSGRAVDEISLGTEADARYLLLLAGGIFLLDVANTFLNNLSGYWGDQMSEKMYRILSTRYYEHLLTLPQKFYDRELSGKLINRLSRSIEQITRFMQMMSNNFLQFILTTVFALVLIAYYSWQVAALLFSLYPIYIYLTVRTSNRWQKYQAEKNDHKDIASGRFAEAISQIKVVKSFIQEKTEASFFRKHLNKMVGINRPQSRFWHVRDVRRRLVLNVIFFFVYAFIFFQAANGDYTPGVAVALILLSQQIRIPIFTISFLVENMQRAIADSKDYFEIMNVKPQIVDRSGARKLGVDNGHVVFDDVSFGYERDRPVIKNISFEIKPDSKVALVGESGEGKSTITNLLMRLYEPDSGAISIDGQNINDVTQKSLRESIGAVFQEPALFSGTIKENIAYARPGANQKRIEKAAKAANAHDFIRTFDKGYDTEIGERGLKLSGGQKQRIAIARAILKDAPILILDEATSSLDSKSEATVQEALERLMRGRTTMIIAHRLSTIKHVDRIVTLKNGKVDEIGSPRELAKTDGIYGQLLKLQGGKTEATKKKLKAYDIAGE